MRVSSFVLAGQANDALCGSSEIIREKGGSLQSLVRVWLSRDNQMVS